MDVLITLNLDPNSDLGRRVKYLVDISNQLTNLYNVVDSTVYKNEINQLIAQISASVLNDNLEEAMTIYNDNINNVENLKDQYFLDYSNFFKNQYTKP